MMRLIFDLCSENALRFAGHTHDNADATVEWTSGQLHYLTHTSELTPIRYDVGNFKFLKV